MAFKPLQLSGFFFRLLLLTSLIFGVLAERVGFEPTVRFPAHTLSKRAP